MNIATLTPFEPGFTADVRASVTGALAVQGMEPERLLPAIALDLRQTNDAIAVLNGRPDEDDGWDQLTDRRAELEIEFKATFRRLTGMDWAAAEEIML